MKKAEQAWPLFMARVLHTVAVPKLGVTTSPQQSLIVQGSPVPTFTQGLVISWKCTGRPVSGWSQASLRVVMPLHPISQPHPLAGAISILNDSQCLSRPAVITAKLLGSNTSNMSKSFCLQQHKQKQATCQCQPAPATSAVPYVYPQMAIKQANASKGLL
eukprot:2633581-Rhodomonas_salina.3